MTSKEPSMSKSVTVQIAPGDLQILKNNGYTLCFARCVENIYSVTWQSFPDYLASNSFAWSEQFQLFGIDVVNNGVVRIESRTNAVDIALGQQATLDSTGELGPARSGGPAEQITLINDYGPIHPALSGVSVGPDRVVRTTPIYVAPRSIVRGSASLRPLDKVQVWFEQDPQPSAILFKAVSNPTVADLTSASSVTVLYQNGNWINPAPA